MGAVKVVGLRAGYRTDSPFMATPSPSLSWRVVSATLEIWSLSTGEK